MNRNYWGKNYLKLSSLFFVPYLKEPQRAEGRTEGEKRAKIEIAQKMLRRGRPLDEIMEDTGLTTEEIEAIRDGSTS